MSNPYELLEIAKDVSAGTDGRFPPESHPYLREVAVTLHQDGWRHEDICVCCPRRCDNHVCSCPHALARKRLRKFGVWPEDDLVGKDVVK
jgi:hypothetical protein